MNYWELAEEPWEKEDNWDGAKWMESRGRKERLERILVLECKKVEND